MNPEIYQLAAKLAVNWAKGLYLRPIPIAGISRLRVRVGIYCACRADGALLYVGSAIRPDTNDGVAARVREHSLRRRRQWRMIWVIPLHDDTPPDMVHAVEGQIIDF